jgi:hypothetical protein
MKNVLVFSTLKCRALWINCIRTEPIAIPVISILIYLISLDEKEDGLVYIAEKER